MDTKLKKLFRNSRLDLPTRWSTPPPPASTFDRPERPRQSLDCPPRLDTKSPQQRRTWRKPLPQDAPKIRIAVKPDYKQMDRNVSLALDALSACDFNELPAQLKAELVRQQTDKPTGGQLKTLGTASSFYPKSTVQHTPRPKVMSQYPVRQTSLSYQNNPQVTARLQDMDKNVSQRLSRYSIESDNTSGEESLGPATPRHSLSPMTEATSQESMPPEPPKHKFELPQIVMTGSEHSLPNSPSSDAKMAPPSDMHTLNDPNITHIKRQNENTVHLRPKVASIKRTSSVRRRPSARRHVSLRRHVNDILSGAFEEADDEWENESDEEDDMNDHLQVWTRRSFQLDNQSIPLPANC
ncbi:hypothetical protein INT44_006436 [Umbelopsis vinacea]|uniref:Uncharacterized protein n=1 Tax=Umbelopsis vinacea TaxID=44442 RepID=A0A8H7UHT3_9FUNG|nr:hypothetical protein INT44_006436 [Umbelopsis vinacea]KAI9286414.1 hypothetical protein BC943DRAFT_321937 [Umbelopsis sp. AD052]